MDTAKQMEMAFMEEGGLTDDGATVDPVSGNEVPPGSLAEEVRDDIPAQLSEGEYVVPADVVRFYGVKFFEDLRGEAKRGMVEMEANGRIGGEPIEMSEGDVGDLTPEEVAALEQVTGMAMGGSVQANPYLQQQQVYSQGYNEGGTVDPNVPQFTQQTGMSFAPGFLAESTVPTSFKVVTLYGPGGEVRTLNLPAQQTEYDTLIQQGYTETPVATTTATTVGMVPQQQKDEGRNAVRVAEPPKFDLNAIKSENLEKTARSLSVMGNIATGLAAAVGAPVAAIINTGVVAQYNDIIERMESEGIETDLERKGSIFGGESSIYTNLKDTGGKVDADGNVVGDGKVGFGDTWLGDALGFDGKVGVQGDNLKDSFGGSRRTGGDDSSSQQEIQGMAGSEPSRDPSPKPQLRPSSNTSSSSTSSGSSSSFQKASDSYKEQESKDYGML